MILTTALSAHLIGPRGPGIWESAMGVEAMGANASLGLYIFKPLFFQFRSHLLCTSIH